MNIRTLRDKATDALGALADQAAEMGTANDPALKIAERITALNETLRITSLILREEEEKEEAAALYLEARAAAFQELDRRTATSGGAPKEREKTGYRP